MNEKLLAWLDKQKGIVERSLEAYRGQPDILKIVQADADAIAQLRAMLKERTDEEQGKMLEDFEYILAASGLPESDWTPGIRAAIKAKRTVTREQFEDWVEYIRAYGQKPMFKMLAELGIEVKE